MTGAFQQTIVAFSVLILIFFLTILIISVLQYKDYKIVDGTAVCVEFVNRCLLAFYYKDKRGQQHLKVSPIAFDEISRSGIFNVKVAYQLTKDDTVNDFLIVGSPYHVFLGSKSMLLIYVVLTFLALLVTLSFIPGLYQKEVPTKQN